MNLGNCAVWKCKGNRFRNLDLVTQVAESAISLVLHLFLDLFFLSSKYQEVKWFIPFARSCYLIFQPVYCTHSQAKRVLLLRSIFTGPPNHRDLKWRSQIIMILKKIKSIVKSSSHTLFAGVLQISCLCRFLPAIVLSPLNQYICRINWISPVILRGNQLMLNQWIGLLVKSAMSQPLKLQSLLLFQYSIHNLSQLIVLSCLCHHIASLHFLKLTLCLTLLHLRISQQFSDPLERTLCSPLFILRKASLTKAPLKELTDSENSHSFLQLLYNKILQ